MGPIVAVLFLAVALGVAAGDATSSGPQQRTAIFCLIFGFGAVVCSALMKRVDLVPGKLMLLARIVVVGGWLVCVCGCGYDILVLAGAQSGSS